MVSRLTATIYLNVFGWVSHSPVGELHQSIGIVKSIRAVRVQSLVNASFWVSQGSLSVSGKSP